MVNVNIFNVQPQHYVVKKRFPHRESVFYLQLIFLTTASSENLAPQDGGATFFAFNK